MTVGDAAEFVDSIFNFGKSFVKIPGVSVFVDSYYDIFHKMTKMIKNIENQHFERIANTIIDAPCDCILFESFYGMPKLEQALMKGKR